MARFTKKNADGSSYHGTTLKATPRQLIDLFPNSYYAENDGRDKVNFDFTLETKDGDVFTIYDWKYYKPLGMDEEILWHLGANSLMVSEQGKEEVLALLS
jgi:hypothetical protein